MLTTSVRPARVRSVVLTATVALALGLLGLPGPSAAALDPFCSKAWPGQVRFVWDGDAGNGRWSTAANWSNDTEPTNVYDDTGYVCIPTGAVVTMAAGEQADLQAIDLQRGSTLVLATGSKLYVFGDHASRASVVRRGATLVMSGALGGTGRIDLHGLMHWTSASSGASTITTRDCALGAACAGPASGTTGLLEVADSGVVRVDGRGVNLFDQYRLVVRGVVSLTNRGYIAADRGTGFALRRRTAAPGVGRLTIANDGGYYEGRTLNGITTLSRFVNAGSIVKTGGTGNSVITGLYTRSGAGSVGVHAGTLSFPDGVTQSARVAGGRTYGTGRCAPAGPNAYGCVPVTEPGIDRQNGTFQVPGADANGAGVQVVEVRGGPADRIGSAVQLHATGLSATRARPAVFRLRYDSSLLGGRSWQEVRIYRKADGARAYRLVRRCDDRGRPPVGEVACVDRREKRNSSREVGDPGDPPGAPKDDVLMVVRTTDTSRWIGR